MRYRLRTLLILLALVAVVFARIAYLKQKGEFHRREASLHIARLASMGTPRSDIERTVAYDIAQPELWQRAIRRPLDGAPFDDWELTYFHEIMAQRYEQGVYCPWRLVSVIEKPGKIKPHPAQPPYQFPSDPELEQIKRRAGELGAPQPMPLPAGYGETPNQP
jgi:hypothetical protein